ncbi:MAG TPA: carboxypeptidase-like regulatory domain-containing protein [Phycisphaerae bacterium]|nr:carboxypeptidase-like regulatory domain-containing protein [Phycisphaerae bacterium]
MRLTMRWLTITSWLLSTAAALGWEAPVNLSNQPSGHRAFGPKIAADPTGRLHLLWAGGVDPTPNWRVYYQEYNGATWSSPVALSGPNATRPDVAVDGNGIVHLVYEEAAERNIWYRKKAAGGSWTSPLNLRSGGRSIAPSISVNATGDRVVVAWHEDGQVGGEWDIFVNIYEAGAWSGVTNISSNASLSSYPKTAIDSAGNIHVGWSDGHVLYRKRDVNGNWSAISKIHNNTTRCNMNHLHASADGMVHAVYSVDDGTGWEIWYRHTDGFNWSTAVNVSNHPGTSDDIDARIHSNALGELFTVWHDYSNIFFSRAASRTSAWSARETIAANKYLATAPDVIIDSMMNARVVWQSRPAQADNWNIYHSMKSVGTPGPTGTLAGEVRDQAGVPLAGATVSTGNAAGTTDASGRFSFLVPVGTYTVTATKPYYTSQTLAGVTINQNQTTTRNFQLDAIGPGPVTDLTIVQDNQRNVLSWINPTAAQFVGTRIVARSDGVYPTGPQDGTLVGDVPGAPGGPGTITHTGLVNGTTYLYAAFAYSETTTRAYAPGELIAGTPAGPGDLDRDGDVDQSDWGWFQLCLTGPFIPQTDADCERAKMDADDDVDSDDVTLFLDCVSGPDREADPDCLVSGQ